MRSAHASVSGSVGDVKIQALQLFGRERHADVLAVRVRDAKAEVLAFLTPPCAETASVYRGEVPASAGDFVEGIVVHHEHYHSAPYPSIEAEVTPEADASEVKG